jgi:hypothetical protein
MKLALLLFLLSTVGLRAEDSCRPSTTLRLSDSQLDEFDATRWVTLTKDQQHLLLQRAGLSPSRVQIEYDCPQGERAELGYNVALKTGTNQIKVLHRYLMSDQAAARKREEGRRMISSSGFRPVTKDMPSFAIDAEGKLWRWLSRQEFENYVSRNPRNILTIDFHVPSSMPSKNTVASADTLRPVTKFAQANSVSTYVISAH